MLSPWSEDIAHLTSASAEWRREQDKCSNILELGSKGLAEQVDAGGEIQGVSHGKLVSACRTAAGVLGSGATLAAKYLNF